MKKIVIVCSYSKTLINFRYELICELIKLYSLTIILPFDNNIHLVKRKFKRKKIKFINIELHRNKISLFSDIKFLFNLFLKIKNIKPNLVLSYNAKTVIYTGLILGFFSNIKHFSMITGLGFAFINDRFKTKILRFIIKFLYKISLKNSAGIIFFNRYDKNLFIKEKIINFNKRTIIINGSGVNLNLNKQTIITKKNIFLMASRILAEKGIFEYIAAAKIIKNIYNNCNFILIGPFDDGVSNLDKKKFYKLINDSGVKYLGNIDDPNKFFRSCKCFVLPSYREGVPHAILKALAFGLPIITTDVPGCNKTVVNNKNGFLVSPCNHLSLSKAMKKIIIMSRSSINKMGTQSSLIARKKFDVNKINKRIINFIN